MIYSGAKPSFSSSLSTSLIMIGGPTVTVRDGARG
jgi:hypothetical protein